MFEVLAPPVATLARPLGELRPRIAHQGSRR